MPCLHVFQRLARATGKAGALVAALVAALGAASCGDCGKRPLSEDAGPAAIMLPRKRDPRIETFAEDDPDASGRSFAPARNLALSDDEVYWISPDHRAVLAKRKSGGAIREAYRPEKERFRVRGIAGARNGVFVAEDAGPWDHVRVVYVDSRGAKPVVAGFAHLWNLDLAADASGGVYILDRNAIAYGRPGEKLVHIAGVDEGSCLTVCGDAVVWIDTPVPRSNDGAVSLDDLTDARTKRVSSLFTWRKGGEPLRLKSELVAYDVRNVQCDSERVFYSTADRIRGVSLRGGPPEVFLRTPTFIDFLVEGNELLLLNRPIRAVPIDGGTGRVLTEDAESALTRTSVAADATHVYWLSYTGVWRVGRASEK